MKKLFLILFIAVIGLTANSYGQGSSNTAYIVPLGDSVNTRMVSVSDTVVWFKFVTTDTAIAANLTYPQGVTPPATNIALYKMQSNSLVLVQQNNESTSISYNNTTNDTSYIKITFVTSYSGLMYFNVKEVNHWAKIGFRISSQGGSFTPSNDDIPYGQTRNLLTLCQDSVDLQCIPLDINIMSAGYAYPYTFQFYRNGYPIGSELPLTSIGLPYTYPFIRVLLPIGINTITYKIFHPIDYPAGNSEYTTCASVNNGQFTITVLAGSNIAPNADILTLPATTCVGSTLILPVPSNIGVSYTLSTGGVNIYPYLHSWWIHCYCPGQTTITVTATSICGGTSTKTYLLNVSTAPEIQSADTTCPSDSVQFNGLTCLDNSIDPPSYLSHCTWLWNFGDGTTSTLRNPTHTYANVGTYTVSFTIKYFLGTSCTSTETVTKTITVVSPSVPVITGNHNNCDLTTTYTIDNPSVNSVYTWAFTPTNSAATGNISGQGNPSITVHWNEPNNSDMNMGVLTVTNTENGCSSTSSVDIYKCCGKPVESLNDTTITSDHLPFIGTNNYIFINGTVTFNCDVNLNNKEIRFGPNAQIKVNPGKIFTIDNTSILKAGCDFMWDGIYVSDPTADVDIIGNSTLQDAINGVVSENGGKFTLKWANMDNNLYSVRVHNYTDPTPHTGSIRNTHFNGGSPLLPPYNVNNGNQKTLCGVECNNVSDFTIGDETDAATHNYFQNMRYGVYATNSNLKIYNNSFVNIANTFAMSYKDGAIYAQYSDFDRVPNYYYNITVGGDDLKRNYFDNCRTGIYTYQYLNTIENNDIKNTGIGIQSLNIFSKSKYTNNIIYDNLGNGVSAGYGIDLRNTHSNTLERGIACLVDSNQVINKRIGISLLGISGTPKTNRLVEVKHNIINYTLNISPLDGHYVPTPSTAKHIGIWIQNSHYSQTKLNTIIRNYPVLGSLGEDSTVLGIKIAESREAYVFQNNIMRMGSGVYTNGLLTNSLFNCNILYFNHYGFRFGFASGISNQGSATGTKYNPNNQWDDFNPQAGHERMYDDFGLVSSFNYYYDPNYGWSYDPHPSFGSITLLPNPDVTSFCINQTGPLGTDPDLREKLDAREAAYGQIVRNERFYAYLEDEYKLKDREYVYEMLRSYPELINLGGEDDNLYLQFYNECFQSDIEKVLKMREEMYAQNLEAARAKLAQIADDSTINTNRKIVDGIYLDTWAQDNFELNDEQVSTLRRIALLTPYAGGDAVYTARVMLNINPDEIAGLDYARPPVHFPMQTKEINAFVFPNPAKDKITVKFTETIATDGSIEFYGMMGNLVYTTTITKGVAETQINVSSLKSGLYFYTVKVNDTKITSGKITIVNK